MAFRVPTALVVALLAAAPPTAGATVLSADLDAGPMTGKERQKACTEAWRRFSPAEKAAQGPDWPRFYSRCVKRLKAKAG